MLIIFLGLVIGICCYRSYIEKHTKKIIIIPKTLPRGAHTVFTLSDTNTMVNKEIITEPKLVVKPIRNGQPQSMELQQWKQNAEFQEPEGQLKLVTKPQPHIATIDTMKSRVATQVREESERKRNQALVIDRVKTNLERELRVIAVLKAKDAANKDAYNREAAASRMSKAASIFPPQSRMSQYVHDPQAKSRTMSMRKNKITNGTIKTAAHDNSFNNSFSYDPRTSTPLSIQRPSSIDMVMSEANLSVFSVDLKPRASKTPRPQPDITVTKRIRDTKKFPTIKELSNMPGEFQNFER
ncbi:uncharacterized protein LOC143063892 [Mytilus galloprovincialis]|uniref:uncharacterized protein LOC143063892 n=1 Tax=Mytilus galloprovincialis TaxID=29158 RepID=UPI003F7C26B3